jgi:hypothetical protein
LSKDLPATVEMLIDMMVGVSEPLTAFNYGAGPGDGEVGVPFAVVVEDFDAVEVGFLCDAELYTSDYRRDMGAIWKGEKGKGVSYLCAPASVKGCWILK